MFLAPMDGAYQDNQSPNVVGLGSNNLKTEMLSDDQWFLLYFIMGTYFGPDIKEGNKSPKMSVLQRVAEGLPPYTSDQLTGSLMKTVEMERVYYYVLRKADKSLTVKLSLLKQFFEGSIYCQEGQEDNAASYPQIPDLFPPELHPQSRFKNRSRSIGSVVFINNPETFYINTEDIERFKRLSGLEGFQVDRDAAILRSSSSDHGGNVLHDTPVGKAEPKEVMSALQSYGSSLKASSDGYSELQDAQQPVHVIPPIRTVPYNGKHMMHSCRTPQPPDDENDADKVVGPAMLFLPSRPTEKEWSDIVAATKDGFALTGSAAMGQLGPNVGPMDIGECEDAYLFRVSLPGVKRDEREFSCEVDTDGKVLIHGITTTGEKTVSRYSQVFEMQTQNLCPPGHFSVAFQLPGPVDPHQFSGNFGTDGILEGIVMKGKRT